MNIDVDYYDRIPQEKVDRLVTESGLAFSHIADIVRLLRECVDARFALFRSSFRRAEELFISLGFRCRVLEEFDHQSFEILETFFEEPTKCVLHTEDQFRALVTMFTKVCDEFAKLRLEPNDLTSSDFPLDPLKHAFYHLLWECERGEPYSSYRKNIVNAYGALQASKAHMILSYPYRPAQYELLRGSGEGTLRPPDEVDSIIQKLLEQGYRAENVTDLRTVASPEPTEV